MAAERPSCLLGYNPIKAGTLHFTQDDGATGMIRHSHYQKYHALLKQNKIYFKANVR